MHSVWKTSIRFTLVTTAPAGLGYPLLVTGIAGVLFPHQAAGSLILKDGTGHRLRAAGAELHLRPLLPSPPLGRRQRLRRHRLRRLQPGPVQQDSGHAHSGRHRQAGRAESRQAGAHRSWSRPPARASIPTSPPTTPTYQAPRVAKARNLSEEQVRKLIAAAHYRRASWACSANPASTSSTSTSPSTSSRNRTCFPLMTAVSAARFRPDSTAEYRHWIQSTGLPDSGRPAADTGRY